MKNKVVIVTGAARGLGQKYAIELSNAGALVVAADILSLIHISEPTRPR